MIIRVGKGVLMPRKSKKIKGLDLNSAEYWNAVLAKEGLTLWEGSSPRLRYVPGDAELALIDGYRQIEKLVGGKRVRPRGASSDSDEK